jgi:hypothetical protein
MNSGVFIAALIFGLLNCMPEVAAAEDMGIVELAAPSSLQPGEGVELQVTAALPQGTRLAVTTEQGQILGAITPLDLHPDKTPTTTPIPVPPSAIVGGRLRLKVEVIEAGRQARPPAANEVKLDLVRVPRSE